MNNQDIRTIFGSNIYYYRTLIGYSQRELAEKCELSSRYISDIENSRGNVSLDTIELLSLALKISPEYLFKEIPTKLKKKVG